MGSMSDLTLRGPLQSEDDPGWVINLLVSTENGLSEYLGRGGPGWTHPSKSQSVLPRPELGYREV